MASPAIKAPPFLLQIRDKGQQLQPLLSGHKTGHHCGNKTPLTLFNYLLLDGL